MSISMRKCELADLNQLREISIETFTDTFLAQNSLEQIAAYLNQSYSRERLMAEIMNSDSAFYFIYLNEELAGYLKLNVAGAQSEPMGVDALEVERIYVRTSYKRKGLGKHLINYATEIGKYHKKKKIWLGVWEKNEKALGFYKKFGFTKTDSHSFYMGKEEQIDFIMTKTL